MYRKLKQLFSGKPDAVATIVLFLIVFIAVAYEYSYYAVFVVVLYMFSLGAIMYNGIKLYGFLKRAFIEKTFINAYAEFFNPIKLFYFLISSLIAVTASCTIFSGMPNVYLLTTSFFVVLAVIIYDLIKK